MNMSMDKPIALSSTVGTRGPQVKNAKIERGGGWGGGVCGFLKNFKSVKSVGTPPSISSPRPSQKLSLRPNVLTRSREHTGNAPKA